MSEAPSSPVAPSAKGFSHVRLTVTDIDRSKAFYGSLLGAEPVMDFSDQASDPEVQVDPLRMYGGCGFPLGDALLGLRPVAPAGDRFDADRVGLDHLSILLGGRQDLLDAADRLTAAGVEHGEVVDIAEQGLTILSVQDPDGINLELSVPLEG